jgi:hypothetical protein
MKSPHQFRDLMKMSTPGIQENLHHQIPGMQETQERV